jgi:hypothetical protein
MDGITDLFVLSRGGLLALIKSGKTAPDDSANTQRLLLAGKERQSLSRQTRRRRRRRRRREMKEGLTLRHTTEMERDGDGTEKKRRKQKG